MLLHNKNLLNLQDKRKVFFMITYNVVFNKGVDKGVYAISVVENPAMESQFIALSEQEKKESQSIKLAEVDDVKFLLAGVVLVPDRDVYRNQDGKEFNIRFSKDTIEEVANNFILEGYQGNSSLEHKDKLTGVSIVQSWVVKDVDNDTANAYGLPKEDIKEGSWIVLYKCDNKEVYNKALSGEIKGFSIDGLFSLEQVNLKSEIEMTKEDLKNFKDEFFSLFKSELSKETTEKVDIKLGMTTLKDGETQIEYEGEELAEGVDVWVVNGEDKAPLPSGEYELEDGKVLVVAEDGKVAEVKEMAEEPATEEPAELSNEGMNEEFKQLMKSLTIKYASETKEIVDALKVELSETKDEVERLKKTPAAVSLSSKPAQKKSYSEMTNYEKLKFNRGEL